MNGSDNSAPGLLAGKCAIVSGGSGELGRALCLEFAGLGAKVAFSYWKNQQGTEHTRQQLAALQADVFAYQVAANERLAMQAMVADVIARWGKIDILVNNIGISQAMPFALIDDKDWNNLMQTNINSAYLLSQTVLPHMVRERAGNILNIGSLAGIKLLEAPVHYSTSKAAITGFTQALSKELGRYGIRVNCLAPGLLQDGVARHLPTHKLKNYLAQTALGRLGELQEVAHFAGFMVSQRNSYMTGQTIVIDGGL